MPTYVISIPLVIDGEEVKYTYAAFDSKAAAVASFKKQVSEQYPQINLNDYEIVIDSLK